MVNALTSSARRAGRSCFAPRGHDDHFIGLVDARLADPAVSGEAHLALRNAGNLPFRFQDSSTPGFFSIFIFLNPACTIFLGYMHFSTFSALRQMYLAGEYRVGYCSNDHVF